MSSQPLAVSRLEFRLEQIRSAVTCEREGIPLREKTVKREFAAISLSTVVREEARFGLDEAKFFCSLLTADCLLVGWRRRVGIEPT